MLKRLLPVDRNLRRALYGLLVFVLCLVVAGGVRLWDRARNASPGREERAVAQAVWQYGPNSQEAADAVKALGAAGGPNSFAALLDPSTGKAIAASQADSVGKAPEEMQLASGVKLPPMARLQRGGGYPLQRQGDSQGFIVRVVPLLPSGDGMMMGAQGGRFGDRNSFRGGSSMMRKGGRDGAMMVQPGPQRFGQGGPNVHVVPGMQAPAAKPEAVLLMVMDRPGISAARIALAGLGALAMLGFVVYWLSVAWWVFADARGRSSRAFAWGLLALLTNLVGVVVYLIARREQRSCAGCGAIVERSFNNCPHCGHVLKRNCESCGQALKAGWTHCANCGTPADPNE